MTVYEIIGGVVLLVVALLIIVLTLLQHTHGQGLSSAIGGGVQGANSTRLSPADQMLAKVTRIAGIIFFVWRSPPACCPADWAEPPTASSGRSREAAQAQRSGFSKRPLRRAGKIGQAQEGRPPALFQQTQQASTPEPRGRAGLFLCPGFCPAFAVASARRSRRAP